MAFPLFSGIAVSGLSTDNGGDQVIAPLLIVLRVANRSALTSETITSGNVGSLHFRSQGKTTSGDEAISEEHPTSSVDKDRETPTESGVGTQAAIDEVPL